MPDAPTERPTVAGVGLQVTIHQPHVHPCRCINGNGLPARREWLYPGLTKTFFNQAGRRFMSICSKMRVLFINFEGVLHATSGAVSSARQFVWTPDLLDMLHDHEDVGIVVHASAREASQADFLRHRCDIPATRWLGVTPPHLPRWISIEAWLDAHPHVLHHRILDGQASEFPNPPPKELILCDEALGVSDAGVQQKIRQWLEMTSSAAPA